jgi:DNA-binding LacI/PurR family transcriptional regulator
MKDRGHLLYRKVYRTLRGRILSGDYEPGAQIETELELTRQLNASVITIRQAEQMLVDEGLLDKQQGRGTFVPKNVTQHLKILGVCGLDFASGLQHSMGPYFSDLIVLSQQVASKKGIEFETAWLPTSSPERAQRYCDESVIREYRGFLFFACGTEHLLLKRVRDLKLPYATISSHSRAEEPRRVWLDYPEAIRLALAQFDNKSQAPLLIMGIDNLRAEVQNALHETGRHATQVYLKGDERQYTFETGAYHRINDLIKSGQEFSRIIFLDDVIAQGATRALLKAGYREKDVQLVVIGGKQEMAPLGFPATFIVHDTLEEVTHAFDILDQKPPAGAQENISWRSGFRVVQNGTG